MGGGDSLKFSFVPTLLVIFQLEKDKCDKYINISILLSIEKIPNPVSNLLIRKKLKINKM